MDGFKDGWICVSLKLVCGKSDVWMEGWKKDKFEIVFVVSQMYG